MSDSEFIKQAKFTLEFLFDIFDEADNDGDLEIDYSGEVLNITTKIGQYVINRNIAAQEMWLSSPVSGPNHFAFDGENWLTKSNINLYKILSEEFLNIGFNLKI